VRELYARARAQFDLAQALADGDDRAAGLERYLDQRKDK
jgi:hypothetical protein